MLSHSIADKSKKVFIINRSEIEGRLDGSFNYSRKFDPHKSKYPEQKLYKICKPLSGGTPSKDIPAYWGGVISWASPKDFKGLFLTDTEDHITEEGLRKSSSKLIPENSVLIVVRSGILAHTLPVTINKVATTINQDLKAFIVNNNSVLPEYLGIYFFVFGKQLLPLITKHSTTVQSINTDQFAQLKIPIPPKEVQIEIINMISNAYLAKKENEEYARNLSNEIDTYILKELEINLSFSNLCINSKPFFTFFSEVTGGRFDPKLYDQSTKDLKEAIKASSFNRVPLKSLITHSVSGDWGFDEKDNLSDDYKKCLVIRSTEFDNEDNLNLKNSRVKYRLINRRKLKKIDIKPHDLLIEKSGGSPDQPVGRVAIITHDMLEQQDLCFSNFIHKLRVDEKIVNPEYLFYFLKTMHNIKLTETMQSQTNGIRNLIMNNYFKQDIILPSLFKQEKIVERVKHLRERIDKLRNEALTSLDNAKSNVKNLILD